MALRILLLKRHGQLELRSQFGGNVSNVPLIAFRWQTQFR